MINGQLISERKLNELKGILPEVYLRQEYCERNLSDNEISKKYGLSKSWVCKLRKIYGIETDIRYRLRRNPLRFQPLSEYQKQVLHGTLFGDSTISSQSSGVGFWSCTHSTNPQGHCQRQYLLRKAEIFAPFVSKVSEGFRPYEKNGKSFPYIRARSFALSQFTEYRNKFYKEDLKIITLDLLKELTPIGLAYWWGDDGCATEYSFDIVTYDPVFLEELESVKKIFKNKLDLSVSITWYKGERNICILRDSHEIMWNYISPEITPDLIYKLPKKYR